MKPKQLANAVTGAPGTISLGGKTYLVGQPTPDDMRAVAVFLGKRVKSPLQKLVDSPAWARLTEAQQDRLLARTMDVSPDDVSVGGDDAMHILTSVDGCRFLAWLLIRKRHPEITAAEIAGAITEENAEQVFVDLDEASGILSLEKNSGGQPGSAATAPTGTASITT